MKSFVLVLWIIWLWDFEFQVVSPPAAVDPPPLEHHCSTERGTITSQSLLAQILVQPVHSLEKKIQETVLSQGFIITAHGSR